MTARRCPVCRYDRAGLPAGARCPECGAAPPRSGQIDPSEIAAARATIALGLGVLAWIGLVGFGILATLLGMGGCFVAWSARRAQRRQIDPDHRVRGVIAAAAALNAAAALTGVVLFVWLLVVL